jgi:hypothetical protein
MSATKLVAALDCYFISIVTFTSSTTATSLKKYTTTPSYNYIRGLRIPYGSASYYMFSSGRDIMQNFSPTFSSYSVIIFTESIFTSTCSVISTPDSTISLTYNSGSYLTYSTVDYMFAIAVSTFTINTAVTLALTAYAEVAYTNGVCT